jgi:hypothetical protein
VDFSLVPGSSTSSSLTGALTLTLSREGRWDCLLDLRSNERMVCRIRLNAIFTSAKDDSRLLSEHARIVPHGKVNVNRANFRSMLSKNRRVLSPLAGES